MNEENIDSQARTTGGIMIIVTIISTMIVSYFFALDMQKYFGLTPIDMITYTISFLVGSILSVLAWCLYKDFKYRQNLNS